MINQSTSSETSQDTWKEQKEKLKAKFAILTGSDLCYLAGKKDEMLTRIEIKLGKTKEELQALIAGL